MRRTLRSAALAFTIGTAASVRTSMTTLPSHCAATWRRAAVVRPLARSAPGSVRCMVASASAEAEASARSSSRAYDHARIEAKWQDYWETHRTFATRRREGKEKKYVLDMFPYPSGAGLHVGHPEGYTASDIMARYWRMRDYDVLHPMGWDSFGLPAEQHAINTGTHPEETTKLNIANFKRQLRSLGFSYDWEREIATTDIGYVKWTQWIFLQLFKRNLAFQSEVCAAHTPSRALLAPAGGAGLAGADPLGRRELRASLTPSTCPSRRRCASTGARSSVQCSRMRR